MKRVYVYGEEARYRNYRLAVEAAGGRVEFGLSDTSDAEALLLPGGGDLEPWRYGQENQASRGLEPDRDAAELSLLARFTADGRPVLGICRGFQTINVFFGGTLCQDAPNHNAAENGDRCHLAFPACTDVPKNSPAVLARKVLSGFPVVNSAHHQTIDRLGAGLCLLQSAPDGVPEAFAHRTLPVWGVQWHPERMRNRSRPFFQAFLGLSKLV